MNNEYVMSDGTETFYSINFNKVRDMNYSDRYDELQIEFVDKSVIRIECDNNLAMKLKRAHINYMIEKCCDKCVVSDVDKKEKESIDILKECRVAKKSIDELKDKLKNE